MVSILPKFKVWHIADKCWLDIASVGFGDKGKVWYLEYYESDTTDNTMYLFIEDLDKVWKLVKSTNLKDKNDNEIFEGSIVKYKHPYDKRLNAIGVVVWNNEKACFGIDMEGTTEVFDLYKITSNNYLQVIGHEFTHQHLLGEV